MPPQTLLTPLPARYTVLPLNTRAFVTMGQKALIVNDGVERMTEGARDRALTGNDEMNESTDMTTERRLLDDQRLICPAEL